MVLGDKSCAELFKLSVVTVACNHFYFTWMQALEVRSGECRRAWVESTAWVDLALGEGRGGQEN